MTRSCILFLSLLLPGILLSSCNSKEQSTDQKEAPPAILVDGIIASTRSLDNTLYSTGSVMANEEVEIRSEINGRVTAILFREGSDVRKGQLLIRIDDSELQANLKKLKLEEKLAEEDVFRKRSLREIDALSQEDLDISVNKLGAIQADIENINSRILKANIRAPFSGRIGLRHISPGAYISPNTLIASLQDIDPIKIEFSIPEKYFTMLKVGMNIQFQVEGNDSIFPAAVYAIEPKVDATTRSVNLRAKTRNPNLLLIPGSFARVAITLGNTENAIVIPSEAIIPDIRGEKVLVRSMGVVKTVYVKTGLRTERDIEIREGISLGDTVVTSGLLQLKEGMNVDVRIAD